MGLRLEVLMRSSFVKNFKSFCGKFGEFLGENVGGHLDLTTSDGNSENLYESFEKIKG